MGDWPFDDLYYDREGNPITDREYAWRKMEDPNYKRVAIDHIRNPAGENIDVSTVWLGIDHRMSADGPPLIFETMIFGGPLNNDCRRYSTEAEAR